MFDVSSRAKLSVSALAERKIASARPRKYGLLLRAEEEMLLYGQALASFCRETHAFVPMRINYPIKPGQIGVRRRHSPSHLETIFSPRPQARLERWYGRRRSKAGVVPPREEDCSDTAKRL